MSGADVQISAAPMAALGAAEQVARRLTAEGTDPLQSAGLSPAAQDAARQGQALDVFTQLFRSLVYELASVRERRQAVTVVRATGTGHITSATAPNLTISGSQWRPVFVRCHFTGTAGRNRFVLSLDSVISSAYDVQLYEMESRGRATDGTGDVNLTFDPDWHGWIFQDGDKMIVDWTNPGGVTWGMEVGLAGA